MFLRSPWFLMRNVMTREWFSLYRRGAIRVCLDVFKIFFSCLYFQEFDIMFLSVHFLRFTLYGMHLAS